MLEQEQKAEEMMNNLTLSSFIKMTNHGLDFEAKQQKSEQVVVESSGNGHSQGTGKEDEQMGQQSDSDGESEKPQPVKKAKTSKKPAKNPSESSDNNIPNGMVQRKEEVLDEDMEEDEILQREICGGQMESQGQESSKIHSNGVNTTIETIQVSKAVKPKVNGKLTGSKRVHRQMNSK